MTDAEQLAALKLRLPDAQNDALLRSLLDEAGAAILAMTGRTRDIPEVLRFTQVKLAAIAYNRMGAEGENSHSEGGLSVSMDSLPEAIRREITPWRLVRTR